MLIIHRRFVRLDVAGLSNLSAQGFVNHRQQMCDLRNPVTHRFPAQRHVIPLPENLFLPVKRQMVAVFAQEDLVQQPRGRKTVLNHPFLSRSHHRRKRAIRQMGVFGADDLPFEKLRRGDIQLNGDLLPDALVLFRGRQHFLRLNHHGFHRQVFGQPFHQWFTLGSFPGCRAFLFFQLRLGYLLHRRLLPEHQCQLPRIKLLGFRAEHLLEQLLQLPLKTSHFNPHLSQRGHELIPLRDHFFILLNGDFHSAVLYQNSAEYPVNNAN